MGVRFPAVSKLRKMLAGESMTHRKELHDLHELPGPTVHRRRALLPLAAAALCASVLVFVHVQQDQAAVLSTASFLVSSRAPATFATKNAATNTNTQREQRLNAAAARAALAQKRVAEKAVKAADAIAAEAGRVGKPQAGGKVPAHCLRCLPHPCHCAQTMRGERTWHTKPVLEYSPRPY